MKQSNRTVQTSPRLSGRDGKRKGGHRGRHEMNRFLRRFLVFVLITLMAAILFAGYASLFPVTFSLNTPVLAYLRDSSVNYAVVLKSNGFTEQTELGMDQQYLRDFADSVKADFNYRFLTDRAVRMQYTYRVDAIVRVHDAANPAQVLLSRQINLLPDTAGQISGTELSLDHAVSLNLAEYEKIVSNFKMQSTQAALFDLAVTMSVQVTPALPAGPIAINDAVVLQIPLDQTQFQLTRALPESRSVPVYQSVFYRLVMAPIPLPVYPAMAAVCFLILVLLLATTCSRKKERFERQLRRMVHQARSRLMMIGDKAWEPEWCVTASDFQSLIRTAKKLKHPVFCYVDRKSPLPAAYFYIYYGENNYCYTFTSKSAARSEPDLAMPADLPDFTELSGTTPPQEPDDRIPLLPEMDDSSEIQLSTLRIQTGFGQH
jgi:hypothetical protein